MQNKHLQRLFSNPSTKKRFNRGIISEYLPWILISIAVLAVVLISIFLLKGKGFSLIDKIKDLFTGG